jgi:GNAT superfamily N-acetyltransferase
MSQATISQAASARTGRAPRQVLVRALRADELPEAETIIRHAFGTWRQVPDLATYALDREYAWSRWQEASHCAFAVDVDGRLAGTNFGVRWGSVGFFGPLTVRPDLWGLGIGQHLVEPVVARLLEQGVRHIGLYTFAESVKHVGLYRKFGFWPRFLTSYMTLPVVKENVPREWSRYSEADEKQRSRHLEMCQALTAELYDGLDLRSAIRAVAAQAVGDTVFTWEGGRLVGFAVCRYGHRSEAGSGNCLVRFGAVRPGPNAARHFDQLLDACRWLAAEAALSHLWVGVNASRHDAYRQLLDRGFCTQIQGVTMHRPNDVGYDREDAFILDDWR